MSEPLNDSDLLYYDRLVNFNKVIQTNLQYPAKYETLMQRYPKFDNANKNFTDRILRGEFVTSTEMNEIINVPHMLSDGTESYYTFAEIFADWCGYYNDTVIVDNIFRWIITDVKWINSGYVTNVTLHKDFQC